MSQPTGNNTRSSGDSFASVRLLIADDQPRVRQSLEALLTALHWANPSRTGPPIEIVGEAHDGQQAVEKVQALHPDVVVLDCPPMIPRNKYRSLGRGWTVWPRSG